MSTDASTPSGEEGSPASRCPACGARVRGHDAWCSLCHHDLRAQPEVAERPDQVAPAPSAPPAPPDDSGATDSDLVAAELLAQLKVIEGGSGLPPALEAVRGRFGRRAIVAAVGLTLTALLLSVLVVAGWLF